jgi:ribonuclease HI
MSDNFDIVEVTAFTGKFSGRSAWSVVADGDLLASAAGDDFSTRRHSQSSILEVLLLDSGLAGRAINFSTNDLKLRELLEENRSMVPNIEPMPASQVSGFRPDMELARSAAELAARKAGPLVLTAATDGARDLHQPHGGFGWVTTTGQHGYGYISPSKVVEAELVAISDLLNHTDTDQPLRVLVDSQHAIRLAREAILHGPGWSTGEVNSVNDVLVKIAKHHGRDVAFAHVPGHSGDPLNERAHRLAVASKRSVTFQQVHQLDALAAEIVLGLGDELAA